jgi:hypothetical protein
MLSQATRKSFPVVPMWQVWWVCVTDRNQREANYEGENREARLETPYLN